MLKMLVLVLINISGVNLIVDLYPNEIVWTMERLLATLRCLRTISVAVNIINHSTHLINISCMVAQHLLVELPYH